MQFTADGVEFFFFFSRAAVLVASLWRRFDGAGGRPAYLVGELT